MKNKKIDGNMLVTVRDLQGSREAHNLFASGLADTVRPWFDDLEDPRVARAIDALNLGSRRAKAAQYLGIEIEPARN